MVYEDCAVLGQICNLFPAHPHVNLCLKDRGAPYNPKDKGLNFNVSWKFKDKGAPDDPKDRGTNFNVTWKIKDRGSDNFILDNFWHPLPPPFPSDLCK